MEAPSDTTDNAAMHRETLGGTSVLLDPETPSDIQSHDSSRETESSSATTTPLQNEAFSPMLDSKGVFNLTATDHEADSGRTNDSTIPAKEDGNAYVGYRTEWCHAVTGRVVHSEVRKVREVEEKPVTVGKGPVFDVVTKRIAKNTDKAAGANSEATAATVSEVKHSIRIYSIAIINALRRVVEYYPGQDLSGEPLELPWPYPILVHHYDKLSDFKSDREQREAETLCMRERNAAEHLGVLLCFLDDDIMKAVREEQTLNQQSLYTFENLWLSYKPGSTVLVKHINDDYPIGYVVQTVSGGTFVSPPTRWEIQGWRLIYDGASIGRVGWVTTLERFDGAIDVSDICIFIDKWDDDTENVRVRELIDWGSVYWSHLKNRCSYHKGISTTFPHNQIDGQVVTDMDSYYLEHPGERPKLMDDTDCRASVSDCLCEVCWEQQQQRVKNPKGKFGDYNTIEPSRQEELGTKHKYVLLPWQMPAYVFKTRSWSTIHVKNLDDSIFDEKMIDNLVLAESRVKTLKSLAKSFIRENKHERQIESDPWTADFVRGKGNGLIFLLHGSPGVGKTYTAEAISHYTRRPLMILTSSDIGTDPATVEMNLTKSFKSAKRWGAVLLIDEADVFMERRKGTDLARNSLVAGFLRALEYYDGILFLTTNRVGVFDDAFISRIHVQLYYKEFTEQERQKVWTTFINKLNNERAETMRVTYDAKEFIRRSDELKEVKWNGREIRNAFQTAVSLAEYADERDEDNKIKLTDEHLREVMELSKDFKEYLKKLHKADEEKRAAVWKERVAM